MSITVTRDLSQPMPPIVHVRNHEFAVDGSLAIATERDNSEEPKGVYRLHTRLHLSGGLSDNQRRELLAVAEKCPVHKLMSTVTTHITTSLA